MKFPTTPNIVAGSMLAEDFTIDEEGIADFVKAQKAKEGGDGGDAGDAGDAGDEADLGDLGKKEADPLDEMSDSAKTMLQLASKGKLELSSLISGIKFVAQGDGQAIGVVVELGDAGQSAKDARLLMQYLQNLNK